MKATKPAPGVPCPRGSESPAPSRVKLLLAFAAIHVLWGSTYLAIRMAIDTIPPFLMAGSRFLAAAPALYVLGVPSGFPRPSARRWRNAAVGAVPLFVMGNGGVTWAEQAVPSGAAALVIATLPAWLLLLDWGYGGRKARASPGWWESGWDLPVSRCCRRLAGST